MGGWEHELRERCFEDHDRRCVEGAACARRSDHVDRDYMPYAMRIEVERLRTLLTDHHIDPDSTE